MLPIFILAQSADPGHHVIPGSHKSGEQELDGVVAVGTDFVAGTDTIEELHPDMELLCSPCRTNSAPPFLASERLWSVPGKPVEYVLRPGDHLTRRGTKATRSTAIRPDRLGLSRFPE